MSSSLFTVFREMLRIFAVARLDFVCLYTFCTAAQSSKSFTSFSPSCMGCIQKVFYKHKRGGSILSVKFSRYSVYQKWDYLLIVL